MGVRALGMDGMVMLRVSREQAVNYRLVGQQPVQPPARPARTSRRRTPGCRTRAPRDALMGLHARVEACEPSAWQDPGLIQTYSPRAAVYVLPADDFGVFTVGRLPRDPAGAAGLEDLAEDACRALNGQELRGHGLARVAAACATGRIAIRWTTSALYVRERERPSIDPEEARIELCRRHVHAFGPTTPAAFAWWAGVSARDARKTFDLIAPELMPVDLAGHDAWVLAADEPPSEVGRADAWGPATGRVGPAPVRPGPHATLRRPWQATTRRCRTGSTRTDSW